MGRNAQLIRQWAILKQIETNRWTTITDLAEHHIVSTKTIRRDLAALMEAGFPLYDERYEGKVYWRLNEEYKGLPLATLSLSETAALYVSKKLVVNLAAPPFSDDIASAFTKIESALPDRNIKFLDSLDNMISVRADAPKDLEHRKVTIRILMEAIGVEVVFNSDIAEYVRSRVWHPSQQVREIGGGRISMKMHVGGEFELGSWILSFGPSATVVSPERLRRRVEAELGRALENY